MTARITTQTGHEAGYGYYLEANTKSEYWSPVLEGASDSLHPEIFSEWLESRGLDIDLQPLLALHSHPNHEILPSYSDMTRLFASPADFDHREMLGTMTIASNRNGMVLLSARTCRPGDHYRVREAILAEILDRASSLPTSDYVTDEAIEEALTLPGFVRTVVLRYFWPKQGVCEWTDLNRLPAFAAGLIVK